MTEPRSPQACLRRRAGARGAWAGSALLAAASLLLLLFAFLLPGARAQDALPGVGAVPEGTTVSGISSGAFMAVQFHVAFSGEVAGVGAVAGGPYLCAEGSVSVALGRCMRAHPMFGAPDARYLLRRAQTLASFGHIDPLENLARARAYVFGGGEDETVRRPVVKSLVAFYRAAGVPDASVEARLDVPAGHGFVVDGPAEGPGETCGTTAPPFLNDCGYDQAGAILRHLLPPGDAAGGAARVTAPAGRLLRFGQTEFLPQPRRHGMDEVGFAYLPPGCEGNGGGGAPCRVHVAFHGCEQGRERLDDLFVTGSGYLNWADAYRLVVLFPQAAAVPFSNPQGCWDFFAHDDPDYATRDGRQVAAVKRMLDRLRSPATPR
jgi:poly(3-hydroxybutyrate) depolymerase